MSLLTDGEDVKMPIVREVQDAISAVADSIGHIRTIAEAVKNGRDYLKTKHPEVAENLAIMCVEMQKSSHALASASAIVTSFSFVLGPDLASEAARFNKRLVDHKTDAETVEQRIDAMRGHCTVIQEHADAVAESAESRGLKLSVATALGFHSPDKEGELAAALQGIYDEEMAYHQGVYEMAHAIRATLQVVRDALGPPGAIDPDNVPKAAQVLGEHATAFSKLEDDCKRIRRELQESIDDLRTPSA